MGYIFKEEVKTNKFDFNGEKLLYFLDFHNYYYYYWQDYDGKEVIYKNKNKYTPLLNFGSPTKIIKNP